jgi:hypothetical protein
MAGTALRGAIEFFDRLGVYDVVLPFLLIFSIVFAILERTKIFGTEKVAGVEVTRKNLNAMTAFVISLLVVASTQIVKVINGALAKVVLLLLVSISFLMLIGTFFGKDEEVKLTGGWRSWGMGLLFIGVIMIFANEVGWLEPFWNYVTSNWDSAVVGSIALIILIVWFMSYVTGPGKTPETDKEKNK